MPLIPAICTQCGAQIEVDEAKDAAICPCCGTAFIVEKAVKQYNVQHATISAQNVVFETPVYEIKIIETLNTTKVLKYTISAYADFGWELKDQEPICEDRIRVTFQRNKNAVWRTSELLELEKRFDECEKNIQDGYNAIINTNELRLKRIEDSSEIYLIIGIGFVLLAACFLTAIIYFRDLSWGISLGIFLVLTLLVASFFFFKHSTGHESYLKEEETRVNSMLTDSQIRELKDNIEKLKQKRAELRKEAVSIIEAK